LKSCETKLDQVTMQNPAPRGLPAAPACG
jgi:hypothetical protein